MFGALVSTQVVLSSKHCLADVAYKTGVHWSFDVYSKRSYRLNAEGCILSAYIARGRGLWNVFDQSGAMIISIT